MSGGVPSTAQLRAKLDTVYTPDTRSALSRWYWALANREFAQARFMILGDSVAERFGMLSTPYKRWGDMLLADLRTRLGIVGGSGAYMPFYTILASSTSVLPVVNSGVTTNNGRGLAIKAIVMNNTTQSSTVTIQGTSCDLLHEIPAAGVGSTIYSYQVDGGTVTNFDLYDGFGSGSNKDNGVLRIPLGASGSHTVVFKWVSGSLFGYLEGIKPYDGDENKGIHGYVDGHHGLASSDYLGLGPAVVSSTIRAGYQQRIAQINPHLLIIALGENDYLHGATAASFKANILTKIADVRAAMTVPPSIVLLSAFEANASGGNVDPWPAFTAAAKSIADSDIGGPNGASGIKLIDMAQTMPKVLGDTWGLYEDPYHPSNAGYRMESDRILKEILP